MKVSSIFKGAAVVVGVGVLHLGITASNKNSDYSDLSAELDRMVNTDFFPFHEDKPDYGAPSLFREAGRDYHTEGGNIVEYTDSDIWGVSLIRTYTNASGRSCTYYAEIGRILGAVKMPETGGFSCNRKAPDEPSL